MKLRRRFCFAATFCAAGWLASPSWAIVTDTTGTYINQTIGANAFYAAGFTGTQATIANIESGYIWNQSILLNNDTVDFSDPSITGQFDLHATAVGSVINGTVPPLINGIPSIFYSINIGNQSLPVSDLDGIAPSATVWSGAIATSWTNPGDGSYSTGFNISNPSFSTPYLEAMVTGVPQAGGQTADIITSSWDASGSSDGNDYLSVTLDALVGESGKLLVVSAGNSGPGSDTVSSPASGTNAFVVGGLQSDATNPPFSQIADFSSQSPTDFFIPADPADDTGTELIGVRARVDITAPATDMVLALYPGNSGGAAFGYAASQATAGGYDVNNPPTDLIAYPFAGTSFSAPIVAGGAGLVVDAGKTLFAPDYGAIDGRVIEAVLMNSADKPAGWNNGQYVNGNGVIFTSQGLDDTYGAGILDLNKAYTQYVKGTTDLVDDNGLPTMTGGNVTRNGWAFGAITHQDGATATVDYNIFQTMNADTLFSATLAWYSHEITTPDADYALNGLDTSFGSFDNLDLSVFLLGGAQPQLIAESAALYNGNQELYFLLPTTGKYEIEVSETAYVWNFTGDTTTDYGLAWSDVNVPEPASLSMLLIGGSLMLGRRRGRRA